MQTRYQSLIESLLNIGSGFFVSLAVWTVLIVPVWHLPVNMVENLQITCVFTVVSVARSYLWRRFFNWRHGKTWK